MDEIEIFPPLPVPTPRDAREGWAVRGVDPATSGEGVIEETIGTADHL